MESWIENLTSEEDPIMAHYFFDKNKWIIVMAFQVKDDIYIIYRNNHEFMHVRQRELIPFFYMN